MNINYIPNLAVALIILLSAAKAQDYNRSIYLRSEKEAAPTGQGQVTPAAEEHYYGARGLITL